MQERLQEKLDRIFQDFKAVNQLKEEIESKEALTDNDKEELEIIQTWVEELQKEINDWAKEYTNEKNASVEIEETIQPKTLKEQFDENRIKINQKIIQRLNLIFFSYIIPFPFINLYIHFTIIFFNNQISYNID